MTNKPLPQPTLQEIVNRAKILVVDDKEFTYLPLFRRDGYTITKWRDVTKLPEIEQGKYDIVLLDLQGIGQKMSADQGLGVLRHIKSAHPAQVVVAYSNADWSLKYQPFFDMADRVLAKSADYVDFKKTVDELLQEHFSVGFHVERIRRELERNGAESWWTRRAVRQAIARHDTTRIERTLKRHGLEQDAITNILAMIQVAIGVTQIWTA